MNKLSRSDNKKHNETNATNKYMLFHSTLTCSDVQSCGLCSQNFRIIDPKAKYAVKGKFFFLFMTVFIIGEQNANAI